MNPLTQITDVQQSANSKAIAPEMTGIEAEKSFAPPVDLKETAREVVAFIDLPGIDEDELQFVWKPNMLTIGGTRDFDHDGEDAEEFTQLQRGFGPFICRIPINDTIDINRASAKYRRGVLKVRMPKHKVSGASLH